MITDPRAFILDNTRLQHPPHAPELILHLADEITPISPGRPSSRCSRAASQAPPEVTPTSLSGPALIAIRPLTPRSSSA